LSKDYFNLTQNALCRKEKGDEYRFWVLGYGFWKDTNVSVFYVRSIS